VYRIEGPLSSTFVDGRSGREYLLCTLDPQVYKAFFVMQRARLSFKCTDAVSATVVQHEANFDLASAAADVNYLKLVLLDPVRRSGRVLCV
jgi:hypothetical protein